MIDLDIDKLEASWNDQKKYLKDGLISGDIWSVRDGLSLSGVNAMAEASALFNGMTEEIVTTLAGSGFPDLNRFYMLNLEDDKISVVINHGDDLMQGLFLDAKKVNIGILFSVAIPKALSQVAAARNS